MYWRSMMHKMHALALGGLGLALFGCGETVDDGGVMAGFEVPALKPGFSRYVAPVIKDIKPGQDVMYCQWISAPMDRDMTIIGFDSAQSAHGHHVVLYANSATPPTGTSRECGSNDMLSVRYVGASAGEGNSLSYRLPEGVVYRIPKGTALMANTHFINPTNAPIDGQAVVDLQLKEASDDEMVAGMFTNLAVNFSIDANAQGSSEATCVVQKDMSFLSFSNHLHEWGRSAYTELVRQDGTREMLAIDSTWSPETVFAPKFATWTKDAPLQVKKGDTIRTHCEWDNTTTNALTFPAEMCVGFAFYMPDGKEVHCTDGEWEE